jgi:hypothetical protein
LRIWIEIADCERATRSPPAVKPPASATATKTAQDVGVEVQHPIMIKRNL